LHLQEPACPELLTVLETCAHRFTSSNPFTLFNLSQALALTSDVLETVQVHFLAKYTAEERNEEPLTDPFCAAFPFTTKPELGIVELVTKVELWYADWGAVTPSGADSE